MLNTRTYTKEALPSTDGTNHYETDYICISSNWGASIQNVHISHQIAE